MPPGAWKDILFRTWRESSADNIGLVAAGVAFYAFLALVPLLGATVLTYGLIASPRTVLANVGSLAQILPSDIASLIDRQLLDIVQASSGKKGLGILAALAVALFGARNAAGSIIIALNIAYEEKEKRGFFKVTALALAITASAVILALLAIAAIGLLQFIGQLLPNAPVLALVSKLFTPLVVAIGAGGAAAALYRYGPSRENARWSWLTPGSLFSAIGWLVVTAGFGIYLTRFANYDATYGSLGAVVALLTWIYLSAYVFLFGGELNSEVEHQTALDTTDGADQPLGGRGAWSADHVARSAGDRSGGSSPLSDKPAVTERTPPRTDVEPAREHPYLASRIASRGAPVLGIARIGMVSSVLATAGLGLIRKRGRGSVGALLLASAAGLAFLARDDQAADNSR